MLQCISCYNLSAAKKKAPDEVIYNDGEQADVHRKKYGLIAKNVTEVKVASEPDFWELLIRQKKKVKEVMLCEKVNSKNYKTYAVSSNCKKFYPQIDGGIIVDNKSRVLFTGICTCGYFVKHTSKKQCDKAYHRNHPYINKVVETNVQNTWGDNNMFAYVKNNNLYITGEIIGSLFGIEGDCYKYDTVQTYFEGKGNQIKQVVCGENYFGCNIFVLMEDGSVWGIGNNNRKLISASNTKKYMDFVKIIDSGVKQIAASTDNVAIVKDDNTLWTWGRTTKSKKKKYSTTPQKIANNVKEVAVSEVRQGGLSTLRSIIVYLKKNHKAYGIGYNQGYAFTDRYKKGWHSTPVFLMKNVKHVYASYGSTLMLNRKNELYWSGEQGWHGGYADIKK